MVLFPPPFYFVFDISNLLSYIVSRAPDRTKITVWSNSYTKVVSSVQEFAGQNNEFSVGMVNRTVEYECALNVCVVNVGSSSAQ